MSRVTAFTGHRVDAPDRPQARLPADLAAAAQAAIGAAVASNCAISSAANGGDVLFQELCIARGIAAHVVLPFAPEVFLERSVRTTAAGDWEARFWQIWEQTPQDRRHIVATRSGENPFAACNQAILELATGLAEERQLIALWDGKSGDGPGGTADMVSRARRLGFSVQVIDPAELMERSP